MLSRIKKFLGMEAKPADAGKVASKEEVEKVAEEKSKPKIGYIHLSGYTGGIMSLSENYDILAPLLTEMVDIVYGQTLVDRWGHARNGYSISRRISLSAERTRFT